MLTVLLLLALAFAFLNGFNDSPGIVAPVISTRAMNARPALLLTGAAQMAGPFVFGTAVASTIGRGLLTPDRLSLHVVIAALLASVAWSAFTWLLAIPSSTSHALVGGLLGAGVLGAGWQVVQLGGLGKILLALLISPPVGLLLGLAAIRLTRWAARDATPRAGETLRKLQIIGLVALGMSHGTSDAPKTMGVIALGLVAAGRLQDFSLPLWVKVVSVLAFALGTSVGGWRQIRTLGGRIFRLRPLHGFSALAGGTVVVLGAGLIGGPISTTQVLASAIIGAGAGERLSQVHWLVARDMLVTWMITIPATAGLAVGALRLLGWG